MATTTTTKTYSFALILAGVMRSRSTWPMLSSKRVAMMRARGAAKGSYPSISTAMPNPLGMRLDRPSRMSPHRVLRFTGSRLNPRRVDVPELVARHQAGTLEVADLVDVEPTAIASAEA